MKSARVSILAGPTAVEPEMVRAHLERILASPSFATAKSARRFLRYVVEETLAGRGDQIKEYAVGVSVFDRGNAYDPRAAAVVRVETIRLRNRLRGYYQQNGLSDPVSIELPKGSYVPVFQSLLEAAPAKPPSRGARTWAIGGIAVLLILGAVRWGWTGCIRSPKFSRSRCCRSKTCPAIHPRTISPTAFPEA